MHAEVHKDYIVVDTLLTSVNKEKYLHELVNRSISVHRSQSSHCLVLYCLRAQQLCILLWQVAVFHTLLGLLVGLPESQYQLHISFTLTCVSVSNFQALSDAYLYCIDREYQYDVWNE